MAKRASKSNTKAAKATAGPTDDQKGSGVKAQTGAEKSAPEPNTAEKRVVADTPPSGGSDPSQVAAALTSAPAAEPQGKRPVALSAAENAELSRQIKGEGPTNRSENFLDAYGPANMQVTVIGPKKGFRRAGRLFNKEPVTFGADEITGRQYAALEAEPKLQVTLSEKPDATADD